MGERRAPLLIGWRRASPQHRVEPRFLRRVEELPEGARDAEGVSVSGTFVTYAY